MTDPLKYTKSEQRVLDLLEDGKPHRLDELRAALGDEEMRTSTVQIHVSNLRIKLKNNKSDFVITTETVRGHEFCLYRLRSILVMMNESIIH